MKVTEIICKFQFLIVRLKSAKLAGEQKQAGVSIPYSTIKITDVPQAGRNFGEFQFLIVRLKSR